MTTCSRRGVLRSALAVVVLGLGGAGTVLAQTPTMTVYKDPT
jgi:hypothetical protein